MWRGPSRRTPVHRAIRVGCVVGSAAVVYGLTVRGSLTLDLGIGRRLRPLGPMTWQIEAPREVVFDVISAPYLGRTPRALERKLKVLERGEDMVLAEHFTHASRLVTTTVETVRFERPSAVYFRLLRGPVPHVVETFELRETEVGTDLHYAGELGTDLWALGQWWGDIVARRWEATVRESLDAVKVEAERRAGRKR